ncbi:MAG: hypothetical protein KDA91_04220 [Planctomycetaceae bacterium]|nr:hypothetical protein [Planctomycetaceae bacterium]
MKSVAKLMALCMALSGYAVAGQVPPPVPDYNGVYAMDAAPAVPMFHHVKYKDRDEMAPCAQPKLIIVKNPCADPCDPCNTQPACVAIQICVPTCGCELVSCKRNGDRVRYDYGKYAVDVRIKKDYIEVDYQD